jgi:DNA polymerase III subunit alpha
MTTPHLGIHSRFEILNGSRTFEDYIEKAKFLQIDTLGISDLNTLGGVFSFQLACQKAGIKSILGETIRVKRNDDTFLVKLYVKNKAGWQNLLRISKAIRVDNDGFVTEKELLERSNGLILVITPDAIDYFNKVYYYKYSNTFKEVFFQLDVTEWVSDERDKNYLLNTQKYFKELYPSCKPVLIQDSYYLDKEDSHIKASMNSIGSLSEEYRSNDQHFKNSKELFLSLSKLFKEGDDRLQAIYDESVSNVLEIAKKCKFEIYSDTLHIPQYEMTDTESQKYKDNETMFVDLIFEGLAKIGKDSDQVYLDRIQEEIATIKKGGFVDYFLILVDVYKFADDNNLTRNVGRGSIGGSLVAYCLGLIKIDPIKYNLLFSRFLNEARILKTVKKEMIILETEQGEIELLPNKEVKVLRESQEMTILAKELQQNDSLI